MKRYQFETLVAQLKREKYHVFSDIRNGWAYISYKERREKIHIDMQHSTATDRLLGLKPLN